MSSVASPAEQKPICWKDSELDYKYIEFPSDTIFMESLTQNATAFPGPVAFVPVQRLVDNKIESHLYQIDTSTTEPAKHIAGPITAPDGSTEVTVFGCHLDSQGLLYLCVFNRNSIIQCDLKEAVAKDIVEPLLCQTEYGDLPSPNDVCLDPNDESILYVVGGTFRNFCCCYDFSNSAFGQVFKVDTKKKAANTPPTVVADGLRTLAGVEVIQEKLWIAQLYDIVQKDIAKPKEEAVQVWKGNDGSGNVWLADNIDVFDGSTVLCPAYTTISETLVNRALSRAYVSSAALFYLQVSTACMRGESLSEALLDPEVSLTFSNTYIDPKKPDPSPVRIILINTDRTCHFEIDLMDTRQHHDPREIKDPETGKALGTRHFFNEQVTHAAHVGEYIVCVNFEQPRLLLLKDSKFREAMAITAVAE
jgi:hypothetical protein